VRDWLKDLPAAIHGGDAPPGVSDFSTGVSPLPPPPPILEAIRSADVTRYPHPDALPLREAIARRHDVEVDRVVAGAGSVELIWALVRAVGGPVGYVRPAFDEYAQAALASGEQVIAVDRLDDPRLRATKISFVARPSNPLMTVTALETSAPFLVVDEAYQPLCGDVAPASGFAVLRSLTKIFALPGLRLGYLIAPLAIARAVRASLPPWNVSQPAIAAGLVAIDQPIAPIVSEIDRLRLRQVAALEKRGAKLVAARGTFAVADVGDATAAAGRLLQRGCRVRDCSSFGLPRLLRIGVRLENDQDRLMEAWR
jgi:histidinol-phosphate/aromatic aminotransferase/cobyric acid decarboxylase-like protein